MFNFRNPYLKFLKQVLKHWPTNYEEANEVNLDKNMTAVSEFIGNNFDPGDFVAIDGLKRVVEITTVNGNSVAIIFLDKEKGLYKAIIYQDSDKFFLESMTFECPICLGDGVLEEENKNVECSICGGTGWGVK